MHCLCFILKLLVDLIELDGRSVNIYQLLLVDTYAFVQRRLVDKSKCDVADLLHREHTRLAKTTLLHVMLVTVILRFAFG